MNGDSWTPDGGWTPADIAAVIGNPFYAVQLTDNTVIPDELLFTEDEWVRENLALLSELGAEAYLRNLLTTLKGETRV